MRQKTIKQIGFVVSGTATIFMWGGGEGTIDMKQTFIPTEKFSKTNMLRAVNDGGFGCEAIKSADINLGIKYDNGSIEWSKVFWDVDSPQHTKYFLEWKYLKEIGIN